MLQRIKERWARPLTVRARVLAAVLALTFLGLVVAGGTAYLLQRNHVDETINDSLGRSVAEFRTLAKKGLDPTTGEPFTTANGLVSVAMQRTVPARNEGMLGFSDGKLQYLAHPSVPVRLEDDQELVNWIKSYEQRDSIRIQTVETSTTEYRIAVIPVQLSTDPKPGLFVLAYDRNAELAQVNGTFLTYSLVALGSLLLIGVVGWLLAGRLLQPIRLVRETAQRIGESDLEKRIPVTGNDDLSELTRTVNDMLDRLQNSFGSQRQLLDDVGHEMRTPITIVRGHLELLDVNDPADVDSTRTITLDELDRMHLLVDDLVTLANVDRPDFVRTQDVDAGQLTDEVLDKASQLGERRWTIDARAAHTCPLDPHRITQAWLQLAANAVKFSDPGSTIAFGSRVDGDRLKLWVRDEGAGIDTADRERIFERFNRGSGAGRSGGSGLGLTIVSAIAKAHGGRVDVVSKPGRGSTFTLDLPARREQDGDGAEATVTKPVPVAPPAPETPGTPGTPGTPDAPHSPGPSEGQQRQHPPAVEHLPVTPPLPDHPPHTPHEERAR
ncbi:sensor histidine kinase [Arthrobacter castelli]|uniref:sensor histidine kinase n=1 Tax=Arthrobacter castelli TaxID=271431 RepID=UPI0004036BC9|nr:sensor histidine kinase [Arthrobacter castelli]